MQVGEATGGRDSEVTEGVEVQDVGLEEVVEGAIWVVLHHKPEL